MKKIIFFYLVLFCLQSNAQQCGSCSKVIKVANYDLDVQIEKPSDTTGQAMHEWRQLFWVSQFAKSKIFELNKNCIRFMQPFTTNAEGKTVLIFGQTNPILPASGSVSKYGDYIITGSVTQSGNGYLAHFELQTACSRQRIAFADIPFQPSSDPGYIEGIGHQAATKLSPLINKINDFAEKQRETDKQVAYYNWGSESITITPKKKQLGAGEETEVEISMKDCDGYALGNREITFAKGSIQGFPITGTTGGTIKPERVTTDAGGKAKVKFKMGDGKTALIAAHYLFDKPTGCQDAMIGSSAINGLPVKVSVEYEADLESTLNPENANFGPFKFSGKESSKFYRRHKSVLYFYPSADFLKEGLQERGLLVGVGEGGSDPKSTTVYETEQGNFYYIMIQQEKATEIESPIAKIHEVTEKADVIWNSGKQNPKRPAQIAFSKGNQMEAMYFSIGFEYDNEGEDSDIPMYHYPGSITVNKNDAGVTMTINKLTDPKSQYKTEYVIECKRDPGDSSEVEKLTGMKIGLDKSFFNYTGVEHLKVRILSPY